ncbi:MAG: response regulator transcription factor [Clostridioides sp.]|jgi:DNA-binding response OmpR family regulator|nr:response regulator transcription factor [Clostridioides sp.]
MAKIFVVDDDNYIRELVRTICEDVGFDVFEAIDGKQALNGIDDISPDLVILDVMMPKINGFEVCSSLRTHYPELPILMLTAKSETSQKVKGLSLGADDYITKPFEKDEFIARIKAILRRYKINSSQLINVSDLIIDKNSYTVNSENIPMKEFELLFELASNIGKTLSRDKLIEDIWGYEFDGNERTLDVHIGRLRERYPNINIVTIRGLGYRLELSH